MPIARHLQEQISRASWIRQMFEEGRVLKRQIGADNVYDFSLGNPILEPPPAFMEALEDAAIDRTRGIHKYMANAGFRDVRTAVADWQRLQSGIDYTADLILMTVGAAGAINVSLKTILNPGEEVVLLAPYFVEYFFYVDNHGGKAVIASTDDEFDIDIEALRQKITAKTRALILNSPNNPTGRVYSHSSIHALTELLKAKQREFNTDIYLITDEPYRAIVYEDIDVPVVASYYPNTILCTSHSKDLGIPGERIGHIAVSPDAKDAQELVNGMAFSIRTLGFVNAPALMQRVIMSVLDAHVDVDYYRRNRDTLYHELTSLGFKIVKPEGAFYLFPKSPFDDDVEFIRLLQKHHILAVPGSGFGTPGYFRISYAVDRKMLERSVPVWKLAAEEAASIRGGSQTGSGLPLATDR